MTDALRTFKILTLGCKVNQYDSQVIREQLEQVGLRESATTRKADCYVINTCTVTNSADSQSRSLIRSAQRENPQARIVVTGCYAHLNTENIQAIEGVDLILNNDDKLALCEHLLPHRSKPDRAHDFEINDFKGHARAFVKVQDGCDNFCSFCKVPYVRGRSRSRSLDAIVREITKLSQNGYKEVVLTGVCLGDYGRKFEPKCDIVDLIEAIEKIDGIARIRLSSIEAHDISDRVIAKMKSSKKLCAHLHIPFQSGDGRILKAMNRRDTRQSYERLVSTLKHAIPNIGISADIMIGFSGESEKEFQNTLDFVRRVAPMRVHIFSFSPRDFTKHSHAGTQLDHSVLKQRYCRLKELCDDLSDTFKQRFMHQTLEVLFEEQKNGFWQGYTRNYLLVLAKNENFNLTNTLKEVTIKEIIRSQVYATLEEVHSYSGKQRRKKGKA